MIFAIHSGLEALLTTLIILYDLGKHKRGFDTNGRIPF